MVQRLEDFRRECRVTTLAEEEKARSPFRLLVACVISLRTKDEVTAEASRRLFAIAADPERLAELDVESIAKAIYPAGFYNTKARQLKDNRTDSARRVTAVRYHPTNHRCSLYPGSVERPPTWCSVSASVFPRSASTPMSTASRTVSGW